MDWNRRPDRSDPLPTGGADDQAMNTTTNNTTTPDLSFYFAIHRHMRSDLVRFADTVAALTPADRANRIPALVKWAKGFTFELEEHHYAEDEFFFPEMRARIPAVAGVLDRLDGEHKAMDVLLGRWPALMRDLADAKAPFEPAKAAALQMATELRDLLEDHLAIEDEDILPMYWRHYTAAEYDAIQQTAIKKGKKKGFSFIAPWSVESVEGAEREAFLASVPGVLRLYHRMVKPRYDRMIEAAFG
jgi:hemerythrin-like domain-containing protein